VLVRGEIGGVVGRRVREGRVLCAFGDENDGVQFHAVAHGDHDIAPGVVEAVRDGCELSGRFAGERWRGLRRSGSPSRSMPRSGASKLRVRTQWTGFIRSSSGCLKWCMDTRCSVERPNYIPAAAFAATWKARVQASSGSGNVLVTGY